MNITTNSAKQVILTLVSY